MRGDSAQALVVARPGGHPQGLTFDREGRLLVSDSYHEPPSRIGPDGRVERFPEIAGGGDTEVSRDGRIFFSALPPWKRSGTTLVDFLWLLLEAGGRGELRVHDPARNSTQVLARELLIPDGVALSAAEDFVVVGDVAAYRIVRHWLAGPRAGETDLLIDGLPGLPDGIASDGRGVFWVALGAPRPAALDWLHEHPALANQVAKLVPMLLRAAPAPGPSAPSFVLAIDEQGEVRRALRFERALLDGPVTTAVPGGESLWLGSIEGRGLARCPLPPL